MDFLPTKPDNESAHRIVAYWYKRIVPKQKLVLDIPDLNPELIGTLKSKQVSSEVKFLLCTIFIDDNNEILTTYINSPCFKPAFKRIVNILETISNWIGIPDSPPKQEYSISNHCIFYITEWFLRHVHVNDEAKLINQLPKGCISYQYGASEEKAKQYFEKLAKKCGHG
jgi:hypothetical protein